MFRFVGNVSLTALLILLSAAIVPLAAPSASAETHGAYVYWTEADNADTGIWGVYRASANGANPQRIVPTPARRPLYLALDLGAGKIYWTETGSSIYRANLDGSSVELVTDAPFNPMGIGLDPAGGKVYWAQMAPAKIRRANLDGSSVEDLVTTGLGTPRAMAVDAGAGKIYWSDDDAMNISRANLDGSNVEEVVADAGNISSLVLDPAGGWMYWPGSGGIVRAHLDGSGREVVLANTYAAGLALDPGTERLYWLPFSPRTIMRGNLDGSNTDTIVEGLTTPWSLAVDPGNAPSDGGAPDTSITSGPTGGVVVHGAGATFTFAGTDEVSPSGDLAFRCSIDGSPYTICTSPKSYSGLSDGSRTFSVRAVDVAGNVDGSAAVATWVSAGKPLNDSYAGATPVGTFPFTGNVETSGATTEPIDPACADAGATVWYRIESSLGGQLTVRTDGSSYATTLAAYATETWVACDGVPRSELVFNVGAGEPVYVLVGAPAGGAGGDLAISITRQLPTHLGLGISPSTVLYGKKTRITATFPDAAGTARTVQIFETPYGRSKHLLAEGAVDGSGKFSTLVAPKRKTTYLARWKGDDGLLPAMSPQRVVFVRALVTGALTWSGPDPIFHVKVAPNHAGTCVRLYIQANVQGSWVDAGYVRCVRLPRTSRFAVKLVGVPTGIAFRIRGEFSGDADHLAGRTHWFSFRR
jgi:hypothetical protein